MTRRILTVLAALAFAPSLASAQWRAADPVSDLSSSALSGLLSRERPALERCAGRLDTSAYVADVRVNVRPGARPSTLYNARIAVSVRSRPRDGRLEGCVRREIRDALRHRPYAVSRAVRARQTFRVAERPDRVEAPPLRFSEADVRRRLRASNRTFSRCLELAGVPESATLHLAVQPSGRLTLVSANVPSGSSQRAVACLTQAVSRVRGIGPPRRRVSLVHTVRVRERAR